MLHMYKMVVVILFSYRHFIGFAFSFRTSFTSLQIDFCVLFVVSERRRYFFSLPGYPLFQQYFLKWLSFPHLVTLLLQIIKYLASDFMCLGLWTFEMNFKKECHGFCFSVTTMIFHVYSTFSFIFLRAMFCLKVIYDKSIFQSGIVPSLRQV